MGLGFLAMVLGAAIASWLVPPVAVWLGASPSPGKVAFAQTLLGALWAITVLPAFAYGLGRVTALSPWPAAVAAVVTGEAFVFAVRSILGSMQDTPEPKWTFWLKVALLGAGVFLTQLSIRAATRQRAPSS